MRIPTLSVEISLSELRREIRYTLAILRQRSWAAAWVPLFEGLLREVGGAETEQAALLDKLEDANAAVDDADVRLDVFVGGAASGLRDALDKDTDAPIWRSMFGSQRPSDFVRPKLGEQLDRMRSWPALLRTAPTQPLRDSAAVCETLIKTADDAVTAQAAAASALQVFRAGKLVSLVNTINGERNSLGGEADKQLFGQKIRPEEASGLFRQAPRGRPPRPETLASIRAEIAAAEQELAQKRQRLAELEAEAQAEAQAAELRRADEAALLAARAAQTEAEKKVAELEKRLRG